MDRKTKVFLTVLIDFLLFVIVCFSTYRMSVDANGSMNRIFSVLIFISIPIMFYLTYMTFAGEKYTYEDKMFGEEDDEDDADEFLEETKLEGENEADEFLKETKSDDEKWQHKESFEQFTNYQQNDKL
ncbi:MAG: hypothetical protein PUG10_05635 [Lachnospiraceae bacterium]|nr:hypothetical protein [Lachnospiraceae bacterium]